MWVMCATNQTWWYLNLPKSAEAPQTAYDDDQRRMEKLWKIGVLQVFLPEKRGLLNIQWLIVILYLVEFSIKWGGYGTSLFRDSKIHVCANSIWLPMNFCFTYLQRHGIHIFRYSITAKDRNVLPLTDNMCIYNNIYIYSICLYHISRFLTLLSTLGFL